MYLHAYEKNGTAYKSENDVSPSQLNCINNKNSAKLTFESENDDEKKMGIEWSPGY